MIIPRGTWIGLWLVLGGLTAAMGCSSASEETPCESAEECANNQDCVASICQDVSCGGETPVLAAGTPAVCVQCQEDSHCGEGQICSANACIEGRRVECHWDWDCEDNEVCEEAVGCLALQCEHIGASEWGRFCEGCSRDSDCAAGEICQDWDRNSVYPVGGHCRDAKCTDDQDCPAFTTCEEGECVEGPIGH